MPYFPRNSIVIDMQGLVFGRLTVLSVEPRNIQNPTRTKRWICRCTCGTIKPVDGSSLRMGKVRSCGCQRAETLAKIKPGFKHGLSRNSIHSRWSGMKARCNNPNNPRYADYGGRGIKLCERWHDFQSFLDDMGMPPFRGATLERKENSKGYEPGNVIWATNKVQCRNKRDNRLITFNNKTQCISAWAEDVGISRSTLKHRLGRLGWSTKRALTTAVV